MDLENTLNNQAGSVPAPAPNPSTGLGGSGDNEIEGISEHGGLNLSGLLIWVCAVLAITATVYFWFLNNSTTQRLADQKSEKDAAIAEIASPTYAAVEAKAIAFQSAVNQLKTAEKNQYKMSDFLPLFYTQINKNVVVANLAVSSDGKLSFNGTTDSYKSAAEQLVTLQNWKINGVNIISSAKLLSVSEDVSKGVVVTFAMSGSINKTASLVVATAATTSTNTTEGGN